MSAPVVSFYRLIPDTRLPIRADRSALGLLPTRAYRYCEAVTSATAFGWWLFPPMDLALRLVSDEVYWCPPGHQTWLPLSGAPTQAAQAENFSAMFDSVAPPGLKGCAPPLLTALPEPGTVQVWTGLFARTAPGWSLLVRPLANLQTTPGLALYEGIVEADHWFGPLFTNMRLTKTDVPVHLRAGLPFLLAQPVVRQAYSDEVLAAFHVSASISDLTPTDWSAYADAVVENSNDRSAGPGRYAIEARRRRRQCPAHLGG